MTVIHVPRPPADAQDKNRRLSELLKAQLRHIQEAERKYVSNIKTEGEAAEFIRYVTKLLLPEGANYKVQLEHIQAGISWFVNNIKTEGEAAEYIRHMTRLLHPEGAEAEAKRGRPRLALLRPVPVAISQPKSSGITVPKMAAQAEETAAVQPPRSGPPAAKARNKAGTARKKTGKAR